MNLSRALGVLLVAGALGWSSLASAEDSAPSATTSAPTATARVGVGVGVVATAGTTDVAWSLAQKVYASASLRPAGIDDARARVLAGETAPSPELSELIELRDGIKGDDAASRQLLGAIADKLSARALVVVFAGGDGQPPIARVFHADTHAFDAARYSPDAKGGWDGTLELLAQQFAPPAGLASAPAPKPAANTTTSKSSDSKSFWQSPWFWVAIGTAVLVGGGVLIATNVQSSDTIHLQLRMPP